MPDGGEGVTVTVKKELKRIIRARMEKSGETYMSARNQVLRDREEILATGLTASTPLFSIPRPFATSKTTEQEGLVDAAILKLNQRSARVRLLKTGELAHMAAGVVHDRGGRHMREARIGAVIGDQEGGQRQHHQCADDQPRLAQQA